MASGRNRVLQGRQLLDQWFVLAVVCLVVLAILGGWLAFSEYEDPGSTTETVVVNSWSEHASFNHYATVVEPNEVFPEGEQVTGMPTYFTRISPTLEGSFSYVYRASESGDVDVTIDVLLILQNAGDESVYWSVDEPIGFHQEANVGENEPVSVDFEVDIPEVDRRHTQIQNSLGASPGSAETIVRAVVRVEGEINGEMVRRTETVDLEISPGADTYSVSNPGSVEIDHETTKNVDVPLGPDPIRLAGFGGLAVLSLVGVASLGVARHQNMIAPVPSTIAAAEYASERSTFDDWISRGELPEQLRTRLEIRIDSLEELVDVAIDCDRRVIEDFNERVFYVIDGELVYSYEPAYRGSLDVPDELDEEGDEHGDDSDDPVVEDDERGDDSDEFGEDEGGESTMVTTHSLSTAGVVADPIFTGVLAALLAGVVIGGLMHATGQIEMVASLVGLEGVAIGWLVHLVHSALAGIVFTILVEFVAPLRAYAGKPLSASGVGVVFGVVCWIVIVTVAVPLWFRLVLGSVLALPLFHWPSLGGLVVFGAILGAGYSLLTARRSSGLFPN